MHQPMLYASDKIDRSYQATRTSPFILSDIKRSLAGPCVLSVRTYSLKFACVFVQALDKLNHSDGSMV